MKLKIVKIMKKNSILRLLLLISFIAINIFPGACFSWGRGPASQVPEPPLVTPAGPVEIVNVNGESYIKALDCIASQPKAVEQDKTEANSIKERIRSSLINSKDGNVPVKRQEIIDLANKFPDCNFSTFL